MKSFEKEVFINELMDSVKTTIINNIEFMPDEWDEHELRHYIAYKFVYIAYKMPSN